MEASGRPHISWRPHNDASDFERSQAWQEHSLVVSTPPSVALPIPPAALLRVRRSNVTLDHADIAV